MQMQRLIIVLLATAAILSASCEKDGSDRTGRIAVPESLTSKRGWISEDKVIPLNQREGASAGTQCEAITAFQTALCISQDEGALVVQSSSLLLVSFNDSELALEPAEGLGGLVADIRSPLRFKLEYLIKDCARGQEDVGADRLWEEVRKIIQTGLSDRDLIRSLASAPEADCSAAPCVEEFLARTILRNAICAFCDSTLQMTEIRYPSASAILMPSFDGIAHVYLTGPDGSLVAVGHTATSLDRFDPEGLVSSVLRE